MNGISMQSARRLQTMGTGDTGYNQLMNDIREAMSNAQDVGGPFMVKTLAAKIQEVANEFSIAQ